MSGQKVQAPCSFTKKSQFFPKRLFLWHFSKTEVTLKIHWKFGKEGKGMTRSKGLSHEHRRWEHFHRYDSVPHKHSAVGSNYMNHFKSLLLSVPESKQRFSGRALLVGRKLQTGCPAHKKKNLMQCNNVFFSADFGEMGRNHL